MRPRTAIVVDDEAPARKRLTDLLARREDVRVVAECRDGPEAVAAIERLEPDIAFLDVQMPEMDGIEVLRTVGVGRVPWVIFVTAWDRHAVEAFETRAVDYLLKPFTEERLDEALARVGGGARAEVLARLEELVARGPSGPVERLPVREDGRIRLVDPRGVDWLEADGNYVLLHAGARTHRLRSTLGGLVERLEPLGFVRIHQSYAVNRARIVELQPWTHGEFAVVLSGGTTLVSSRTYSETLRRMTSL